jgi:putative ABC transport system ATP-binding protein
MPAAAPICRVAQAEKTYQLGEVEVKALQGVDVEVQAGEFTVFSGPSGSGKTTLLNLIGLLDRPTRGRVELDGRDVSALGSGELGELRARRIGFIFQSFNLIPVLTAAENIDLALRLAEDPGPAEREQRVARSLEQVGLGGLGGRKPAQLSGGQQQRVAIARALVKAPALVIADEPTANLDTANGQAILDLMEQLNRDQGATFLFSTHDPAVKERARRVVYLRDGRIEREERR